MRIPESEMNNDFIDDFIEEYKNQPCLWQAKSENFKNRKKRQEAYLKLIDVASKHGEHYNIERTKQKINNLRCAFRHQLKKYTECKNNKTGKEEPYCPKRRYFESLMFLMDEEKPPEETKVKVTEKQLRGVTVTRVTAVKKDPEEKVVAAPVKETRATTALAKRKSSLKPAQGTLKVEVSVAGSSEGEEAGDEVPIDEIEYLDEEEDTTVTSNNALTSTEVKDEETEHTMESESADEDLTTLLWPKTTPDRASIERKPRIISVETMPPTHAMVTTSTPSSITIQPITITNTTAASKLTIPSTSVPSTPSARHRLASISSSTSSQIGKDDLQQHSAKKIKIDCSSTDFEKLLSLACSKIDPADVKEDDYSIFGKMVAYKLRSMDAQQSLFAEKIITDVLLDGQLKRLKYPTPSFPSTSQTSTAQIVKPKATSTPIRQNLVISSTDLNGIFARNHPQSSPTTLTKLSIKKN